jgi:hypothetical protein
LQLLTAATATQIAAFHSLASSKEKAMTNILIPTSRHQGKLYDSEQQTYEEAARHYEAAAQFFAMPVRLIAKAARVVTHLRRVGLKEQAVVANPQPQLG